MTKLTLKTDREDERERCPAERRPEPDPIASVWSGDDANLLRGIAASYPYQSEEDRSVPDHLNSIADKIERGGLDAQLLLRKFVAEVGRFDEGMGSWTRMHALVAIAKAIP